LGDKRNSQHFQGAPRPPYIMEEGQIEGHEKEEWRNANVGFYASFAFTKELTLQAGQLLLLKDNHFLKFQPVRSMLKMLQHKTLWHNRR